LIIADSTGFFSSTFSSSTGFYSSTGLFSSTLTGTGTGASAGSGTGSGFGSSSFLISTLAATGADWAGSGPFTGEELLSLILDTIS